jgi:hypothetical protein
LLGLNSATGWFDLAAPHHIVARADFHRPLIFRTRLGPETFTSFARIVGLRDNPPALPRSDELLASLLTPSLARIVFDDPVSA